MGAFYGNKIKKGEINPKTGNPWNIADVPKLWVNETIKWLEENQYV